MHGESQVKGSVLLGGFRLAAVLVGDGSSARLEVLPLRAGGFEHDVDPVRDPAPGRERARPADLAGRRDDRGADPQAEARHVTREETGCEEGRAVDTTREDDAAASTGGRVHERVAIATSPSPGAARAGRAPGGREPTAKRVYRRLVGLPPETTKSVLTDAGASERQALEASERRRELRTQLGEQVRREGGADLGG